MKMSIRIILSGLPRLTLCFGLTRAATRLMTSSLCSEDDRMLGRMAY